MTENSIYNSALNSLNILQDARTIYLNIYDHSSGNTYLAHSTDYRSTNEPFKFNKQEEGVCNITTAKTTDKAFIWYLENIIDEIRTICLILKFDYPKPACTQLFEQVRLTNNLLSVSLKHAGLQNDYQKLNHRFGEYKKQHFQQNEKPDKTKILLHEATNEIKNLNQLHASSFYNDKAVKLLIDPEQGDIIDANNSAVNYYGYSKEQLLQMNINDINSLKRSQIQTEMERARKSQRNFFRFIHRKNNGQLCHVKVFSTPVKISGRTLLLSTIIDVLHLYHLQDKLSKSSIEHFNLFNNVPVGILVITVHKKPDNNRLLIRDIKANKAFKELMGYNAKSCKKELIEELKTFDKKIFWLRKIVNITSNDKLDSFKYFINQTGRLVLVDNIVQFNNNNNKIIISYSDITNTALKDRQLQIASNQFKYLANTNKQGIVLLRNGLLADCNTAFEKMTETKIINTKNRVFAYEFIDKNYHVKFNEYLNTNNTEAIELRFKDYTNPVSIKSMYYEGHFSSDRVFIINDLKKLNEYQKEIRLAQIEGEEIEKERIARELHDGLGPMLTAGSIYTSVIKNKLSDDDDKALLTQLDCLISDVGKTVRDLSHNLSPAVLKDYGLEVAIDSYIKSIRTTEFEIHFHCEIRSGLSDYKELALYRCITEMFNNTIKHANATRIELLVSQPKSEIIICYADNGIGFNLDESRNGKMGIGISNMQNRIETIGGQIRIMSVPGNGTTVIIRLKAKKNGSKQY
ncbi:PAS domain-containing protein [Carboxylicivirga marina]|uniref:PAS domain S-box protein n=1 Tax=Carboxylicivirga marina TaxID=2800988 RepID=A0ABS1HPR3_9BACT|nr:PAS domain-containing protein [Carboxylicivirga marina]MBK3519581.1 PAS domain S-box protein [Carboxylicivirga marina]